MTALQMIGSLLAIPSGSPAPIRSITPISRPRRRCQSLRANIVSMLDKSADASTLRMLVRRDVATFETTCGAVDPEAVAAFKNLLAAGHPTAPAHPAPPPQQVAHEPARPLHEAAKPAPAPAKAAEAKPVPAVAEAKPAQLETGVSDAKWVASVRDALIHAPEPAPAPRADTVELPADVPSPAPVQPAVPVHAPRDIQAPALSLAPPAAEPHAVAPALPPAASVAAAPEPASPSDHPVPPAAIPDPAPMPAVAAAPQKPARSGIRGAIAEIPLLGRLVK